MTEGKYKAVVVTRRGSPEVLEVQEKDLRLPAKNEVRIKILATPVCLPDVEHRYGKTPVPPKIPFITGYAIVGEVDALGENSTAFAIGDMVAALTIFGGYAEYIYLKEYLPISVPKTLDPAEVAVIMLNYIVPYQALVRKARVTAGNTVLIIGASGGVGTAYLQLGQMLGLKMYGVASKAKHHILERYGAIPIDYKTQDFIEVLREMEPEGIDAIFDGMQGENLKRGFKLLRKGGVWVHYGNPYRFKRLLWLLGKFITYNLMPNGKRLVLYGTTTSKFGRQSYLDDWDTLFELLEKREIEPIVMERFGLLEARKANELLESGTTIGTIVLLAEEEKP